MSKMIKRFIIVLFTCFVVTGMGSDIPPGELRGVWVRPPASEKEITDIFNNLQKARINVIFLETFYNGFTVYPSDVFEQRPDFKGIDILDIFIREARKRDMEIHCWLHTLYWRPAPATGAPQMKLLDSNPGWLDLNHEGRGTREFEKNYDFVNPSVPGVREKLEDLVKEIVLNYPVDGIHLDYIRYAANGDKYGFGYHSDTIQKFKKVYRKNPEELDPMTNPSIWELWSRFREDQITEIVKLLSSAVRSSQKNIKISAAVFPDYYQERFTNSKLQHYQEWCANKYLDFITPMCYSYSTTGILEEIRMANQYAGHIPVFPGLAARAGTPHPDFPVQIEWVRKENPKGHVLFSYGWMTTYPDIFQELAKGPYQYPVKPW